MNKIHSTLAIAFVALSAGAFAQTDDVARKQRMDEAYASSQHDTRVADSGVREDAREARHAIHRGLKSTGHAIHQGLRATGHAIHRGAKATGHAIHKGVDKVTGK